MKKLRVRVMVTALCLAVLCSLTATSAAIVPPVSEDSLKAQMVRDWERAKAYTKEYLDAMPEDGINFKPSPEVRSFAEQMLHLSQGTIGIVSTGTGKAKIYEGKSLEKMDEFKTKAALTTVVMESYDYAIGAIKGLDASKLGEPVKMSPNEMTRMTCINKAFEHQTHHRGQSTVYLRLKGVKPPNERLF